MFKKSFMLAKVDNLKVLDEDDFIFEPKLDGTRVMVIKNDKKISLINRRNKDISFRYPELKIADKIKARRCVLDAELVILDEKGKPNFNLLQQREQTDKKLMIELKSREFPATLFVFDILEKENKILTQFPLLSRKKILEDTIIESPHIMLCPYTKKGRQLWEKIQKEKLEGIIAKRSNSVYECGRSENWLKVKNVNTIDAIIIGFTRGKGARQKSFGALILACYLNKENKKNKKKKLIQIGRVGTGFDRQIINYLSNLMKKLIIKEDKEKGIVWLRPKLIAEVKFLELTKAKELRAPSFVRLRFDKRPEDCIINNN